MLAGYFKPGSQRGFLSRQFAKPLRFCRASNRRAVSTTREARQEQALDNEQQLQAADLPDESSGLQLPADADSNEPSGALPGPRAEDATASFNQAETQQGRSGSRFRSQQSVPAKAAASQKQSSKNLSGTESMAQPASPSLISTQEGAQHFSGSLGQASSPDAGARRANQPLQTQSFPDPRVHQAPAEGAAKGRRPSRGLSGLDGQPSPPSSQANSASLPATGSHAIRHMPGRASGNAKVPTSDHPIDQLPARTADAAASLDMPGIR